jgi:hypothetical protein
MSIAIETQHSLGKWAIWATTAIRDRDEATAAMDPGKIGVIRASTAVRRTKATPNTVPTVMTALTN